MLGQTDGRTWAMPTNDCENLAWLQLWFRQIQLLPKFDAADLPRAGSDCVKL